MPSEPWKVHPVLKQLTSERPRQLCCRAHSALVTQIDGLLTPAEATYLVQEAHEAGFEASETQGGGECEVSSLRTSRTAVIPEHDPVVDCVRRRLATIAGMPVAGLEPLQEAQDQPR